MTIASWTPQNILGFRALLNKQRPTDILRHSFVAGLKQSIANTNGVHVDSLEPEQISHSLKVNKHFENNYLLRKRGARAGDLCGLSADFLNDNNHPQVDYVDLDCGSNDIVSRNPALNVEELEDADPLDLLPTGYFRIGSMLRVPVCSK